MNFFNIIITTTEENHVENAVQLDRRLRESSLRMILIQLININDIELRWVASFITWQIYFWTNIKTVLLIITNFFSPVQLRHILFRRTMDGYSFLSPAPPQVSHFSAVLLIYLQAVVFWLSRGEVSVWLCCASKGSWLAVLRPRSSVMTITSIVATEIRNLAVTVSDVSERAPAGVRNYCAVEWFCLIAWIVSCLCNATKKMW